MAKAVSIKLALNDSLQLVLAGGNQNLEMVDTPHGAGKYILHGTASLIISTLRLKPLKDAPTSRPKLK